MNRLALALCLVLCIPAAAEDWPQFRGPTRDGHSKETGLLRSWPQGGPKLLWSAKGLGRGYSSVAVAGGRIYVTGLVDGQEGYLFCLDTKGKLLWEVKYGEEWNSRGNYPGARTTPTVHDGRVYLFTGYGVLHCFDAATGKTHWTRDAMRTFGGRNIQWGISESVLIEGEMAICTPGGQNATVVAYHRKTGKPIWTTRGLSERSAYCSPVAITHGGARLVLTTTEANVIGIAARTGQVLWKVPMKNNWRVHANTPLYHKGLVYVAAGYGWGGTTLKLSGNGAGVSQVWQKRFGDTHHGGLVLIGNHVYSTSSQRPRNQWVCVDIRNGNVAYQERGVGKGSVISADGMLYCYGEGGTLALAKASPEGLAIVSRFPIEQGSGMHWAHPTISGGVLYIRHGDAVMAFDIKAK